MKITRFTFDMLGSKPKTPTEKDEIDKVHKLI